jgi:hypothetical protein
VASAISRGLVRSLRGSFIASSYFGSDNEDLSSKLFGEKMPRPPVGTRTQGSTATALAAHIASRLCRVPSGRDARDAWLTRDLALKLRSNGLDRAASRAKPATRAWVLVDEKALPLRLEKAFVVFPGDGRRRPRLMRGVGRLGAVRQIMVTRSRRDVICVLLYAEPEREAFFAAVELLGERFLWDDVIDEDRGVEADAWVDLVRRFARQELLSQ